MTQVTTVTLNSVTSRSTIVHTGQQSDQLISGFVTFTIDNGLVKSTLVSEVGSITFIQNQVAKKLSVEKVDYIMINLRSHQHIARILGSGDKFVKNFKINFKIFIGLSTVNSSSNYLERSQSSTSISSTSSSSSSTSSLTSSTSNFCGNLSQTI